MDKMKWTALVAMLLTVSCRPANSVESESAEQAGQEPDVTRTEQTALFEEIESDVSAGDTGVPVDLLPERTEWVRVIYGDREVPRELPREEWDALFLSLRTARYDERLNGSGVMIKMVTPDYTLMVKENGAEENQWISLWKDGGKMKYRNFWYALSGPSMDRVAGLVERYR